MTIRLIDIKTLRLKSFNSKNTPPYAILSHTWVEDEEVSFQEICQIVNDPDHAARRKSGFNKIFWTCRKTYANKLQYAWVDTCCIDKSSSAELSEAINSMFRWYRDAAICFAYLSDYSQDAGHMTECQWFTRGWCLQELIAPASVVFYDKAWGEVGSKSTLIKSIASITRIDAEVLEDHTAMYSLPVARRMSWASNRVTTRVEDIAYCLLGIFDINMPMLYGEGDKAFLRLQEEIIRRFNDTSIFLFCPQPSGFHSFVSPKVNQNNTKLNSADEKSAISSDDSHEGPAVDYLKELSTYRFCGMFANSPADFRSCGDIVHKQGPVAPFDRQAFSVTNRGIQLGGQVLWCNWGKHCFTWEADFRHSNNKEDVMGGHIGLRKIGRNLFARVLLPPGDIILERSIFHEDVCVLPHMVPETQYQIHKSLRTVLLFDVQDNILSFESFARQKPQTIWDESGKFFFLPETLFSSTFNLSPINSTLIGSLYFTVKDNRAGRLGFYLWFLFRHRDHVGEEALVRLSRTPTKNVELPGLSFEDAVVLQGRNLSAHSSVSHLGIRIDAKIYREPAQGSDSQVYTCLLETSREQYEGA